MADDEELNDHDCGFEAGMSDLCVTARETVDEWYALKLVDDRQMLALERLMHHLDIIANHS